MTRMEYCRAEFAIECADDLRQTARELLAGIAGDTGFESFEDTEKGINGFVRADLFRKEELDNAISRFPLKGAEVTYVLSAVVPEDWNKEWEMRGFLPIDIDGKLVVYDAKKPVPVTGKAVGIGIEAQLAFGTGTHETTRLILSCLMGIPLKGKRVLDCGCGTGILGIAASKLGAGEVVCFDIDEWSVRNTLHNAATNGVPGLSVMEGDASVLSHVSGMFDVVMANINRNTLMEDISRYKEVLNGGGTLILSGFYTGDIPLLKEKAAAAGLAETERREMNGWCMLVFQAGGSF